MSHHPSSSTSSLTSFRTALGSPMTPMAVSISSGHGKGPLLPRYRPGIPLPEVIRTNCHVFFDVKMYNEAIALLQDLVVPGTANPDYIDKPIIAPLPLHIEFASALLIHPFYTKQESADYAELPSRCITFLRNLLAVLGPINANLEEAFSFSQVTSRRNLRHGRNRTDIDDGSSGSDTEDGYDHPKGLIANQGRIRRCAQDFWHMVGWAFNCSVRYPKRWKYWKVWLEYMLDVLDADWFEREEQDLERQGIYDTALGDGAVEGCEYTMCQKTLLITYLSGAKGRSGPMKRIIRSAFADGCAGSLKEFPEVWPNETKEVKPSNAQKRKREEEPGFGDYDNDEESSLSLEVTDQILESSQESEEDIAQDSWLGGTESIALRQRVIVLLSRVSAYFPGEFAEITDVYDAIYTNMKPLPLPAFSLFFSPSVSTQFPPIVFVSLTQLLLLRLLPIQAPRPHIISGREGDNLSQDIIERCFLPFPANTHSVSDNAKVSILSESVFRFFLKNCETYHTPSLDTAVEQGILARESKAKGDRKKKDYGVKRKEDEEAWLWLRASGERLRTLRGWVEENSQAEG